MCAARLAQVVGRGFPGSLIAQSQTKLFMPC